MSKRIRVKFLGGFKDGLLLDSEASDPKEAKDAVFYYQGFLQYGTVGAQFQEMSEAAIAAQHSPSFTDEQKQSFKVSHVYELTVCDESRDEIRLTCEYRGQQQ